MGLCGKKELAGKDNVVGSGNGRRQKQRFVGSKTER
jgi:hypothetical protein